MLACEESPFIRNASDSAGGLDSTLHVPAVVYDRLKRILWVVCLWQCAADARLWLFTVPPRQPTPTCTQVAYDGPFASWPSTLWGC
jgi:hypothetical protein